MMTSKNPGKQTGKKNLYLILGIVAVCFLFVVGTIQLVFEVENPAPSIDPPTATVPRINIPSIQYSTVPPSAPSYTVPIHSIGSSGVTGTLTFEDISGIAAVLLHVDGLEEEVIAPVELRHGSCANLGSLAYPLVPPDAGESETDLSINLEQFNTQKPLAVILYRSTEDHTAIACGDIP